MLWFYILDDCDHAGIWHVDFEIASIRIGEAVTEKEARELFEGKIIIFDNDEKWFIPSFVIFQYGVLNDKNNVHKSVIDKLKYYKIYKYLTPWQGLTRGLKDPKDKEQDKDMDKDKEKDKEKVEKFEEIWKKYPRKLGKDKAIDYFKKQVKTDNDLINIEIALTNYIADIKKNQTEAKFIQHGSTWFNKHWKSWIDYKEPVTGNSKSGTNIIKDLNYKNVKREVVQ